MRWTSVIKCTSSSSHHYEASFSLPSCTVDGWRHSGTAHSLHNTNVVLQDNSDRCKVANEYCIQLNWMRERLHSISYRTTIAHQQSVIQSFSLICIQHTPYKVMAAFFTILSFQYLSLSHKPLMTCGDVGSENEGAPRQYMFSDLDLRCIIHRFCCRF